MFGVCAGSEGGREPAFCLVHDADLRLCAFVHQGASLEQQAQRLSKFIRSQTGPAVYYLPAKHNDTTQRLLEEQQSTLETRLSEIRASTAQRLAQLTTDLEEAERRFAERRQQRLERQPAGSAGGDSRKRGAGDESGDEDDDEDDPLGEEREPRTRSSDAEEENGSPKKKSLKSELKQVPLLVLVIRLCALVFA